MAERPSASAQPKGVSGHLIRPPSRPLAAALGLHSLRQPLSILERSQQHPLQVFEVRTAEGYGARWLADGSEFRGFLEPQMEEGHSKGWRHS